MFSRKTLKKYIWPSEIRLYGGQPRAGCTERSPLPHPYDKNTPETPVRPQEEIKEGELEKEVNSGPNFVTCIDPKPGAKRRTWFESTGTQESQPEE